MRLNDLFYTIQGEGKNAGRAAWFFRVPHCNLDCPWCDTEFNSFTEYKPGFIEEQIRRTACRFAVVTGGEPSMNKQVPELLALLKKMNFEIAMESNGQFIAPASVDHLTISPKRWNAKQGRPQPHEPFWFNQDNHPSEIKIVVDGNDALEAASQIFRDWYHNKWSFREPKVPRFYLSPEWSAREKWLPVIVQYVKENPLWKVNLQTHKILNVK
jgi:7-carboxy-7-deazaguanine synthase